jgi:hypothetical protein
MISLILASIFTFKVIEVGLGIGTNTPIGNMERFFSTGATGSIYLTKELGANRISLDYEISNLPSPNLPTYQLQLQRLSLEYGYSIYRHNRWSLPIYLGISNVWLKRKQQTLTETGIVQAGELGIGFHEDISRANFGAKFFVSGLYYLGRKKTSAYIIGLKFNLGYEF